MYKLPSLRLRNAYTNHFPMVNSHPCLPAGRRYRGIDRNLNHQTDNFKFKIYDFKFLFKQINIITVIASPEGVKISTLYSSQ